MKANPAQEAIVNGLRERAQEAANAKRKKELGLKFQALCKNVDSNALTAAALTSPEAKKAAASWGETYDAGTGQ